MNAIQKYFKYRQSLIDQYAKGDMTKREYLQRNYEAVVYGDISPFRNIAGAAADKNRHKNRSFILNNSVGFLAPLL